MPYLLVNIGLNGTEAENMATDGEKIVYITQAIYKTPFSIHSISVLKQSETEQTYIAKLWFPESHKWSPYAYKLSKALNQDYIAFYNPQTKKGELIGPKAKEWGPFNEDYFIFP